ncbi:hypothetical protein M422DRAFT_257906 [Sphaerobolus stellatus SS14]|uniref:Uncharacterized protein n=1 Tax=Sphaerobolus stellatus (strain SS14) TaxID=990650 RepID=A0A0C9VMW0_SPHS4|nr:hypothetical protein M422DRAFT_257906 [Sphaerobolus stellatus SS14]
MSSTRRTSVRTTSKMTSGHRDDPPPASSRARVVVVIITSCATSSTPTTYPITGTVTDSTFPLPLPRPHPRPTPGPARAWGHDHALDQDLRRTRNLLRALLLALFHRHPRPHRHSPPLSPTSPPQIPHRVRPA